MDSSLDILFTILKRRTPTFPVLLRMDVYVQHFMWCLSDSADKTNYRFLYQPLPNSVIQDFVEARWEGVSKIL